MKKVCSILLAVVMVACAFSATAFAAAPDSDNASNAGFEKFVEMYSDFFSEPEKYSVLDANDEDVTTEFYDSYSSLYLTNNFDALFEEVCENGYVLSWIEASDKNPGSRSVNSEEFTASRFYSTTLMFEGIVEGAGTVMTYTISGTYTVSNGIISSHSDASLDVFYNDAGDSYVITTTNKSTTAIVTSNKTEVTFSGYFYPKVSFYADGVLFIKSATYGPYYANVSGNA